MLPQALALVATVFTLMSLGFFVLGSTPLLILKHEVPMDSKVIRQVFHYCYRLVTAGAGAASLGFALTGRPLQSLGLGAVALLALGLHHWMMTRMDRLRMTMHDGDKAAIRRFRQLHIAGIALNVTQLVAIGVGLVKAGL